MAAACVTLVISCNLCQCCPSLRTDTVAAGDCLLHRHSVSPGWGNKDTIKRTVCNLWKHSLHLKRFVKNEHMRVSLRVGEVSPSFSNSVLLHLCLSVGHTWIDASCLSDVLLWTGCSAVLCVLSSDAMWGSSVSCQHSAPGTLLSRCSSPKSRVLLPEGTCRSNFILLYVPLCTFLHTTQLRSSL